MGAGVGVGVAGGSVGPGVGVGPGVRDGSADGDSLGSADGVGQGSATTSDPVGDGTLNDGTMPLGSGVGTTKQVGDGLGEPQPSPATIGPQVEP